MKLYIAGPMTGLPNFNYPAFNAAEAALTRSGFEVLNPVMGETPPTEADAQPWDWYMRRALGMVIEADGIALLKGWETSRGAKLERIVGEGLGLPVGSLYDWLAGKVDG